VSNHYLSAISYEARVVAVISAKALRAAEGFRQYEMEDDVSQELAEFALANAIYTALVEGHAAEISARRTAMENASNVGFFPRMRRIKADGARHRTHWT
jgi:F-type H+-transporting ATPase subunit gamma